MIIEDVPIESVRNINPNLRDNDRSSLTYLSFSLVGLMQETVLEVTPAFFNFSEILSINTLYKYINILKALHSNQEQVQGRHQLQHQS